MTKNADTEQSSAPAEKAQNPASQLFVDLGPAIAFMVSYNLAQRMDKENAIFWATGVFMAAVIAAILYAWRVQKRVPPMLIVTGVIVLSFGALTILLHNAWFAYVKPTIINLLFAGAIFGGLLVKRNVWKILFQSAFQLPDRIWDVLALRWGVFYVFLAGLNEFIWRNFSEAFWANFKVVGVIPITIAFALANLPITMKFWGKTNEECAAMRAPKRV